MALSGSTESKSIVKSKKIKDLPSELSQLLIKLGFDANKCINEPQKIEGHLESPISWLVQVYKQTLENLTKDCLFNTTSERIAFLNLIQLLINEGADPNQICRFHQPYFQIEEARKNYLQACDDFSVIHYAFLNMLEKQFDAKLESESKEKNIYLVDLFKKCPELDPNLLFFDDGDYVTPLAYAMGCNSETDVYDIELIEALVLNPELDFKKPNHNIYTQAVLCDYDDHLALLHQHGSFAKEHSHLEELFEAFNGNVDNADELEHPFSLFFQMVPPFPFEEFSYLYLLQKKVELEKVSTKLASVLMKELQYHLLLNGVGKLAKEIKSAGDKAALLKDTLLEPTLRKLTEMKTINKLDQISDKDLKEILRKSNFKLVEGLEIPQQIIVNKESKTLTPLAFAVLTKDKLLALQLLLSPKVKNKEMTDLDCLKLAIENACLPVIHLILKQIEIKNPAKLFEFAFEEENYANPMNRFGVLRVLLENPHINKNITTETLLEYLSQAHSDSATVTILLRTLKLRIPEILEAIEKSYGDISIIPNRNAWLKNVTQYFQERIHNLDHNTFKYLAKWLYTLKLANPVRFSAIEDLTRLDLSALAEYHYTFNSENHIKLCLALAAITWIKLILQEELNAQNRIRLMEFTQALYQLNKNNHTLAAADCASLYEIGKQCVEKYGEVIDVKELDRMVEMRINHLKQLPDKKGELVTLYLEQAASLQKQNRFPEAIAYYFLINPKESVNDFQQLISCLQSVAKSFCTERFNTATGSLVLYPNNKVDFVALTQQYQREEKETIPLFHFETILFEKTVALLTNKQVNFPSNMKLNIANYYIALATTYEKLEPINFEKVSLYLFAACNQLLTINQIALTEESALFALTYNEGIKGYKSLFIKCIHALMAQGDKEMKELKFPENIRKAGHTFALAWDTYFSYLKKDESDDLKLLPKLKENIDLVFNTIFNIEILNEFDFAIIDKFIGFQLSLKLKQLKDKTHEFYLFEVKRLLTINTPTDDVIIILMAHLRALISLQFFSFPSQIMKSLSQTAYRAIIYGIMHYNIFKNWTNLWNDIAKFSIRFRSGLSLNQPDKVNKTCISFLNYAEGLACLHQKIPDINKALELIKEAIKLMGFKNPHFAKIAGEFTCTLVTILCRLNNLREAQILCEETRKKLGQVSTKVVGNTELFLLSDYFECQSQSIKEELNQTNSVLAEVKAKNLKENKKKKSKRPKPKIIRSIPETIMAEEKKNTVPNPVDIFQNNLQAIKSLLDKFQHEGEKIDLLLKKIDSLDDAHKLKISWSFASDKQFCKRTKLIKYKTTNENDLESIKHLEIHYHLINAKKCKLKNSHLQFSEQLLAKLRERLLIENGHYQALLTTEPDLELALKHIKKGLPENEIARKLEQKRLEKQLLEEQKKQQRQKDAEERKKHTQLRQLQKEIEKTKTSDRTEVKSLETKSEQEPESKHKTASKKNHLSRKFLLELTVKHLTFISVMSGLYEFEKKDAPDVYQFEIETHYALLYDIFRCFSALRVYQEFGGQQSEQLNLDIVVDLRNMIHHYGAKLTIDDHTVLNTAKKFAKFLPAMLQNIKKPYLMESVLTDEQLKTTIEALNFVKKDDIRLKLQPETPLVIADTLVFQELNKIVVAHDATLVLDEKEQKQNDFEKIWQLISYLKNTLDSVKEKHKEPPFSKQECVIFSEFYFRKINASKMLISYIGEFGDPKTCHEKIKLAQSYCDLAYGDNLKQLKNIINFYNLLLDCRKLHNQVGHSFKQDNLFADFDIKTLYNIHQEASLITKPDLNFLEQYQQKVISIQDTSTFYGAFYYSPKDAGDAKSDKELTVTYKNS